MGGLMARYRSEGGGGDSARVAKFEILTGGELFTTDFAIGMNPSKEGEDPAERATVSKSGAVEITNSSEVAVKCTFYTESKGNLPLKFDWNSEDLEATPAGDGISFAIAPNATVKVFDLQIDWDVEEDENRSFLYNRQVDMITTRIVCEQID